MDRTVRPVPQHPVRQRHPQRLPRHRPAPGQQRPERPAGAVLAEDRADGLFQSQQCHRGRHLRLVYRSGRAAVPNLLRPHQRRRRGPDDMEQALRSLQRHRQPPAFAQPAARRVPGRAAQWLHRHRRPRAAILPLPHERLPEQHPLCLHRRPFRRGHRGRRAGLPGSPG